VSQVAQVTLIFVGIYGLLALSLNLQYGLTGLLNFGQVIFFAFGGYAVAIAYNHGLPDWAGIVGGLVAGAGLGVLMALPSRRLAEEFWALLSLGVAAFFIIIVTNVSWLADGSLGVYGISLWPTPIIFIVLAVTLTVLTVATELARKVQFGRVIRGIRDDPLLIQSLGRSVLRFRIAVLGISGAIGALGGIVYAHWITYINPDAFGLTVTLLVFTMMLLGGSGNTYGVLVGTLLMELLSVGLQYLPFQSLTGGDLALLQQAIYAVALMLLLMFRRQGLIPERTVVYRNASRRRWTRFA
jgi:branched-chain amino acid transport system permease protein